MRPDLHEPYLRDQSKTQFISFPCLCLALLITELFLVPLVQAQTERFGAVAGTYQACNEQAQPLRKRLAATETGAQLSDGYKRHVRERLAIQLDECARLGDSPLNASLEAISAYRELGIDDRAYSLAQLAIQRFGATTDLNLLTAQILYRKGRKEPAVVLLKKVIDDRSSDVDANQLLGAYYYGKGDVKSAIPYLRVVADARGDRFEPNAALGDACLEIKDLECAGEYLTRASRLKPDNILLATRLGDLERSRGSYGNAIEAYERVLAVQPGRLDAMANLNTTYALAGQYENALAGNLRVLELKPDNIQAQLEAAKMSRKVGRPRLGTYLLEGTVSKDPVARQVEYLQSLIADEQISVAIKYLAQIDANVLQSDDRLLAVSGDALLAAKPEEALRRYKQARARRDTQEYAVREARALRLLNKQSEAVSVLKATLKSPTASALQEFADSSLDLSREQLAAGRVEDTKATLKTAFDLKGDHQGLRLAVAALEASSNEAAKSTETLARAQDGAAKTLVTAWQSYSAGDYGNAAAKAQSAREQDPGLATSSRLLQGAALVRSNKSEDALSILTSPGSDEWRAQAVANVAEGLAKNSKVDAARKLVRSEKADKFPPAFEQWLSRVVLVAQASDGKLRADEGAKEVARISKGSKADIDVMLSAVVDIDGNDPAKAMDRVRTLADSGAKKQVQTRATIEMSAVLFKDGKADAAEKQLRSLDAKSLPPAAQMNLQVMQNYRDASKLLDKIEPFAKNGMPAAVMNTALALDRSRKTGKASMEPLQKVVGLEGAGDFKRRAETLLVLKKRLYN